MSQSEDSLSLMFVRPPHQTQFTLFEQATDNDITTNLVHIFLYLYLRSERDVNSTSRFVDVATHNYAVINHSGSWIASD